MSTRIATTFAGLRDQGRAGLVIFVTAGDPDAATSQAILDGLPAAGADMIELGMPFTDPMADGPSIQAASRRALLGGQTLVKTLAMVQRFRERNTTTPLILMGYYNPIDSYGRDRFLRDAVAAGADGLIIVDLPPEEDDELCIPAAEHGLAFIRLATPTSTADRLDIILDRTAGFLYYVSITGITGTRAPDVAAVAKAIEPVRARSDLPIAIGFGVRTPGQAAELGAVADAVVVGSAVIDAIAASLADGRAGAGTVSAAHAVVGALAGGMQAATPVAAAQA